jgi:hypothetical protein
MWHDNQKLLATTDRPKKVNVMVPITELRRKYGWLGKNFFG